MFDKPIYISLDYYCCSGAPKGSLLIKTNEPKSYNKPRNKFYYRYTVIDTKDKWYIDLNLWHCNNCIRLIINNIYIKNKDIMDLILI